MTVDYQCLTQRLLVLLAYLVPKSKDAIKRTDIDYLTALLRF